MYFHGDFMIFKATELFDLYYNIFALSKMGVRACNILWNCEGVCFTCVCVCVYSNQTAFLTEMISSIRSNFICSDRFNNYYIK